MPKWFCFGALKCKTKSATASPNLNILAYYLYLFLYILDYHISPFWAPHNVRGSNLSLISRTKKSHWLAKNRSNIMINIPFHTWSGKEFPWAPLVAFAIFSYTVLCSLHRFRRRNAMLKKFNYPDEASLSRMTNVDAQAIMQYLASWSSLWYWKSLFNLHCSKSVSSLFNIETPHILITGIDLWHSHDLRTTCVHQRVHYGGIRGKAICGYKHTNSRVRISFKNTLEVLYVWLTD